jgi:hypothetical protein
VSAPGCTKRCSPEPQAQTVVASSAFVVFRGMCDASGAVPMDGDRFAVADDEDNVLRVYSQTGGAPRSASDLSAALDLPARKNVPEADIEAATAFGDYALWLTSHGLTSSGRRQPSRFRFFATRSRSDGSVLELSGKPYAALLADMIAAPALARFELGSAAERAPKAPGGLNIEGMTRRADLRSIYIGFRNPVPDARALLVPLLNPLQVATQAAIAEFGTPQLLDLGGLGVRALALWRGRYVIVAGGIAHEAASRLFLWDGQAAPRVLPGNLASINPEAVIARDDSELLLLLSDDGDREIGGTACKKLVHPRDKQFRGLWLRLPER